MQTYNQIIGQNVQRQFRTKGENIVKVNDEIQPTIEVFTPCNIVRSGTATNSTTATIYTTPTNQDFYLTAVTLSYIKDVTSTSTSSAITATIDGITQSILRIPQISVTVGSGTMSLSFPIPIKLDRGFNIAVVNATNIANISANGCIIGYLTD